MKYKKPYDVLTFDDLTSEGWNIYLKKHGDYRDNEYMMDVETTEGEKTPSVLFGEDELENLATFCRAFLHAWEFAQKQEDSE